MPKSIVSVVEDLVARTAPSKDAPTRFDLYGLEDAIKKFDPPMPDFSDLEEKISELSDQVETLGKAVADLTSAVEKLLGRV